MTDPTSQEGVDLTKEHTLGQEVDIILRALHVRTHVIDKYALRFHTRNRQLHRHIKTTPKIIIRKVN